MNITTLKERNIDNRYFIITVDISDQLSATIFVEGFFQSIVLIKNIVVYRCDLFLSRILNAYTKYTWRSPLVFDYDSVTDNLIDRLGDKCRFDDDN